MSHTLQNDNWRNHQMALLTLDQISVAYQKQDILKDFHLDIEEGKLISLLELLVVVGKRQLFV